MERKEHDVSIETPKCGIIMPISGIDGCPAEHWKDVLVIIKDVIQTAGFEPNLVSHSEDIGIIQKRIIQNVYSADMIICDVSGKNPNVMFELGMRLAFDKPTVIIKDDKTEYTFDTSVIEHLTYPRDLRFSIMVDFKENLKSRLIATHRAAKDNKNYSTFLKNFGQFKVSKLEEVELSSDSFLIHSINEINEKLERLSVRNSPFEFDLKGKKAHIKSGMFSVLLEDFGNQGQHNLVFEMEEFSNFRELLDHIYFNINEKVDAFCYGFDWVLLNTESGKIIESLGMKANKKRGQSFDDGRSLKDVGIVKNSLIKVVKPS